MRRVCALPCAKILTYLTIMSAAYIFVVTLDAGMKNSVNIARQQPLDYASKVLIEEALFVPIEPNPVTLKNSPAVGLPLRRNTGNIFRKLPSGDTSIPQEYDHTTQNIRMVAIPMEPDRVDYTSTSSPVPTVPVAHSKTNDVQIIHLNKRRLRDVFSFMDKQLENISAITDGILANPTDWPDMTRKKTRIIVKEEYFQSLQDKFHVIPIMAKTDELHKIMLDDYYNYTSDNCSTLEDHSQTLTFNMTCRSSPSEAMESVPLILRPEAMNIGMPLFNGSASQYTSDQWMISYLMVISNGVITENGDVVTGDYIINPHHCAKGLKDKVKRAKNITHYTKVFSAHQQYGEQIYHGSFEVLQRIAPYIHFLQKNPNIKIHLRFHHPLVSLLGLDSDRFITTHRVSADVIYLPQGGGCCLSPPFQSQVLSMYMRNRFNYPKRDTVVLIKRSHSRSFETHTDIVTMLQNVTSEFGLSLAIFADDNLPSFSNISRMFSKSVAVVGPHGAGFCNMILSQPGTLLIEGLYHRLDSSKVCFLSLAEVLGHRFHGVYADDMTQIDPESIRRPLVDYLTNIH